MSFLDKNGLQVLTNKLVQGDAIRVASHRGHTIKNVIDNITREHDNISTPNSMTIENRVNEFKVGKGRDVDVSGDVEEAKIEVELQGKTWQTLNGFGVWFEPENKNAFEKIDEEDSTLIKRINDDTSKWAYWFNDKLKRDLIKPNSKYTIIFKMDSNKNHRLEVSLREKNSQNAISNQPTAQRVFSNIYLAVLTTESNFEGKGTNQAIYFHGGSPTKAGDWARWYKDVVFLEGDYSNTPVEELPKHFEGIKSSFEDGVVDIQIDGKNLFNVGFEEGRCIRESGVYFGSVAETSYEPFYEKKISFNIGEPLRSLPNGVCDEIRNNKGQWELVRRVHKVVLDGSEGWKDTSAFEGFSRFSLALDNQSWSSDTPIGVASINDKFINRITESHGGYEYIYIQGSHSNTICFCQLTTEKASSLDTFKNWLSKNPTTIYYELKEPAVTPIESIEFDIKPHASINISSEITPISKHKVILNRAGQIERGITQIAELKKRVDALEVSYDSYLLETQHKLSILGFEYELESEEI